MTNRDFEIWLAIHGYTQAALAEKLGIRARTITLWKKNEHFPKMFLVALKSLEIK